MVVSQWFLVIFLYAGNNYSSAPNAGGMTIIGNPVEFSTKLECEQARDLVRKNAGEQIGAECTPGGFK